MKKFLNFHGLGALLSVVVISSLLTTGLWWKVAIIGAVFIFQAILESFNRFSYLKWNQEHGGFKHFTQNGDTARSIWFSAVKLLSAFFVIGYSFYYGKQLTFIESLATSVLTVVAILLYHGNDLFPEKKEGESETGFGDRKIGMLKKFITISLMSNSLFIAYLNFGTGYVWLSVLLAAIFLVGLMVNDLIGEVQFENTKTKKVVIIVASLLPLGISIISTIYQFWVNIWGTVEAFWILVIDNGSPICDTIWSFFTYRIGTIFGPIGVWLLLIIILVLAVMVKIIIDSANYLNSKHEIAVKQAIAAQEKAEAEELRRKNFEVIIYSLANDKPISKEFLVYLGKNYSFVKGFPIRKLADFNFDQMFTISDVKRKIIWEHDLEGILEMYNSFFKKTETSDQDLDAIINAVKRLCKFIRKYEGYEAYNAFNRMLDSATPNIPPQWQK
ncbi:MAG: hypothetical protein WAW11_05345 [Patescibacteria group bacterium]